MNRTVKGAAVIEETAEMARMQKEIKALTSLVAKAGWFATGKRETYDDGTEVAYVAAIQDNGSPEQNIPARPFMSPAKNRYGDDWIEKLREGSKAVLDGKLEARGALAAVGQMASQDIAAIIQEITDPPLAESTIQARLNKYKGTKDAHAFNTQTLKDDDGDVIGYTTGGPDGDQYDIGLLGKPLIDTGLLYTSLTFAVTKRNKEDEIFGLDAGELGA